MIISDKPGKKRTLGEMKQEMKVVETNNTAASSFVPFHDVSTVQSLIDSKASKTDATSISQQGRKVLKAKRKRTNKKDSKDSPTESPEASPILQVITKDGAQKAYQSLLHVFSCSRQHLIVGRDQEEQAIKSFITSNIESDTSGLLYVCGHPGQGKTAVLNQVLFDYFGEMDSSLGGISDELYILKYNAMRYTNSLQFAQSLSQDLAQLTDFEFRRGTKLIKTLRIKP